MKIKRIFESFLVLFFISCFLCESAIPPKEREALIALYNNTNGDEWENNTNWKGNKNEPDGFSQIGTEGTWYGITVLGNNVIGVNLTENNLVGTIPTELGNLKFINKLILRSNQLTGNIPSTLGNLRSLTGLYLENNKLTGNIPIELGNLVNLVILVLRDNNLSGNIPAEMGNLKKLERLRLSSNQLTGNIPPEIGELTSLIKLNLDNNSLSGIIPSELGKLSNLDELNLNSNQLSGFIPPEIGNLSKLKNLYFNSNGFNGIIPVELGKLTQLEELLLHFNQIEGNIPESIKYLSNIKILAFNNNQLTGNIPTELTYLSTLQRLNLSNNNLFGNIPFQIGNLSNLIGLTLNSNQLQGIIPKQMGNLSKIETINLSNNQLEGQIPEELGQLKSLCIIQFKSNRLVGDIPESFGNLLTLTDSISDFRWNAIYTKNEQLRSFLNSKQLGGNWESTQTVAPELMAANSISPDSIKVSWSPIPFSNNPGGYEVYYSLTQGGPYLKYGSTISKHDSQLDVTGLNPNTLYYFVVQTRTDSHNNNNSILYSYNSEEVSAMTMDTNKDISGKVISSDGGLEGVTLTFNSSIGEIGITKTNRDGDYIYSVYPGWRGTITPSKSSVILPVNSYFRFSPSKIEFDQGVYDNKKDQNFKINVSITIQASREIDRTVLLKKEYAKININASLFDISCSNIQKFELYKKQSGENFIPIKDFQCPIVSNFTFEDKFLDKNNTYTYVVVAFDLSGKIIGESNEITL